LREFSITSSRKQQKPLKWWLMELYTSRAIVLLPIPPIPWIPTMWTTSSDPTFRSEITLSTRDFNPTG
jgi:hypothetical protein